MGEHTKIWIYASNRKFTANEQDSIREKANRFMAGWTAHDKPVFAEFVVLHDVFLILSADGDKTELSGCGIDKSVALMKEIENDYTVRLFNRSQIELLLNNELVITSKEGVKQLLDEGRIGPETLTFDKMLTTGDQFPGRFMIPLKDAWYNNLLNPVVST